MCVFVCVCMCVCVYVNFVLFIYFVCVCAYVCMYVCVQAERELRDYKDARTLEVQKARNQVEKELGKKDKIINVCVCVYIYMCMCALSVCIYTI